ncbi:RNA polymerase sigma factor SigI [Methylobacterium organophilum]|uniref:RNA polymerase sigma factor SigI n=2 Tax=Methylobacterium organophilum TaxID=410 RepID=A0ABQ4TAJ2_METOR|nr:RNA polymerase sigma factor SigI [Methylobacterium organophilum]
MATFRMAPLGPPFPLPVPAAARPSRSAPMGATAMPASGETALAEAMRAAQDGDADAYRRLLRDCVPAIARMARAQGVRGAGVDDVVQETLLTLHRARASYDPARPFLPWLNAIAQRRAIDALRHGARRPREVHDPAAYEARPDEGRRADHGVEAGQSAARLTAAVATLPEGQRQAVEHLALRELSLEEAASLTGRSKGALKVNLHRALKTLRAALSPDKDRGDV